MSEGSPRSSSRKLKADLRRAGLSDRAIQAAWPSWWSSEAEASASAQAELRFALARNLGLSAPALLGDRVDFVWKDEAKFKHLLHEDEVRQSALASFAVAVGQLLVQATPAPALLQPGKISASDLRKIILKSREYVDLQGLLSTCWAIGIPVVHLRIFPLDTKGMHAMAVRSNDRHAILLGRDANYPAPIAFDLAHELGHIALGHLSNATALIDVEDPGKAGGDDEDEQSADKYALTLLTGNPTPEIRTNVEKFSARQLARAAGASGRRHKVEPGTLALCAAYKTDAWATAFGALRQIYPEPKPAWREVNQLADSQLSWDELGHDAAQFLFQVIGLARV